MLGTTRESIFSADTPTQQIVYVILCWAYFPIVFCLYPETSRRTLEDMDEIFIRNPSLIVCGKPELTQRERPQAFIEAETQRIADAENEELGKKGVDGNGVTAHDERV